MSRKVEVYVFRHSIKDKSGNLTPAGEKLALETGVKLGKRSRANTFFFASTKPRTQQTAGKLREGISTRGGRVEEKTVIIPELAFHSEAEPEPRALIKLTREMEDVYGKKGGAGFLKAWNEGRFDKQAAKMEEVGGKLAGLFAEPYHRAQENGNPIRYIFVSHGDSNVESIFYALTGVNPAEVKGKGPVPYMGGFKLKIDGKKMQIEFRNRQFPIQDFWKGIMRKQNSAKRESAIERNIAEMVRQRKARVARRLRDPKRRTWKG